ncbi:unnamed protein product [Linum trigynum]|uniref:Uncharacterized protein n=2 Tax=Linum trigynum TaxID=586398 RepID=A0AAV2CA00_9ROSI
MQTEMLPMNVCRSLDQINRSFIWGETDEKQKLHLVPWQRLLAPKQNGGLGIRSTREVNLAMLAKGRWRVIKEKETLWTQLVRSKYGKEQTHLNLLRPVQGSSFTWSSLTKARNLLRKGCAWNIHRGNRTNFWYDVWLTQVPLQELATGQIPEEERELLVEDFVDEDRNWKTEKFDHILPLDIVRQITARVVDPLSMEEDTLLWQPTSNERFSTKSAYQLLQDTIDDNNH